MVSNTFEQIKSHINKKQNFLLSGGAGSGKTYSLVQILQHIYTENPKASVACVTFTKEAVKEIKSRFAHDTFLVSTIHDFLWQMIGGYQKDLKNCLVRMIREGNMALNKSSELVIEEIKDDFFKDMNIQYKEYRKIDKGVVSHDDVLKLSHAMFKKYPLLRKILKNKFDYVFVDEYQDTNEKVVDILLDFLQRDPNCKNIIGFFGDKVQKIYDSGVGDIVAYIEKGAIHEVVKQDNYRCSVKVIELLNKIRGDLKQEPSGKNLIGSARFLYSENSNVKISDIKQTEFFKDWDFKDFEETKELYLTHKLIAKENGFESILQAYKNNTDSILKEDNQDRLIKHLFKIYDLIYFYEIKDFNSFIKRTDFKIKVLSDKLKLKEKIDSLKDAESKTIGGVIDIAHDLKLVIKDDDFNKFTSEHKELYEEVRTLPSKQILNVYLYVKQFTPFSTQHNVKGTEYNNVLVVLDNGRWTQYNFEKYFDGTAKDTVLDRTFKIFYVCCSRAKQNLVVYYHMPTEAVLSKAKEWFGENNIHKI